MSVYRASFRDYVHKARSRPLSRVTWGFALTFFLGGFLLFSSVRPYLSSTTLTNGDTSFGSSSGSPQDHYNSRFKPVLDFEQALPQHNENLPWPEGRNGRYLHLANSSKGSGWNNILREQLLSAYVAYLSQRGYVFPPHISSEHLAFEGAQRDLVIPSNSFAYSPWTGAPFTGSRGHEADHDSESKDIWPRSISQEFFETICPRGRRVTLHVREVEEEWGVDSRDTKVPILELVERWAKKLRDIQDTCVEVVGEPMFNYMDYDYRILPVWPGISSSPILKEYDWSPAIHAGLEANGFSVPSNSPTAHIRRQLPKDSPWALDKSSTPDISSSGEPFIIKDTLAIHLRRGDFEQHCSNLASWHVHPGHWSALGLYATDEKTKVQLKDYEYTLDSRWTNTSYPALGDHVFSPAYAPVHWSTSHEIKRLPDGRIDPSSLTIEELLKLHCWQSLESTRNKLHDIRKEHPNLKKLYFMTNGKKAWIEALKMLLAEDGWDTNEIRSSLEMDLDGAAKAVNQGVDMALANWAEVFLGNLFSSLTANVVGFRLAQGYPANSVYFF